MTNNTSKIMTEFVSNIDNEKRYTLAEINKILTVAYNKITKDKEVKTPRPPSEYIKFIQNRMKEIKKESPGQNAKEIMKTAASEWNSNKSNVKGNVKTSD